MKPSLDKQLGLKEGTILRALRESTEDMHRELVNTWWKKIMFWWIVRKSKNAPK